MLTTLQHHKGSFIFMAITLFLGCIYGYNLAGVPGVITVFSLMIILSLLEISLSIDNAIVIINIPTNIIILLIIVIIILFL